MLLEFQIVRVPWDNCLLEPSEDRVEGHCKKETTRWTTLSYTSGHQELSSFCSREFHVRGAVINTSQEAANKTGQLSVLEHREDPGMIDIGIAERTQRGPERYLKDVVRHLLGRRCISVKDCVHLMVCQ